MRLPRLRGFGCSLVCLAMLVVPSSAMGVTNHPFLHAITNLGLEDACGVARRAGGLYVSDYYHDKVLIPGGEIGLEDPGHGPCTLALDASGDLYVVNWHHSVVKYSSSELLSGTGAVIDSNEPTGVAVDQVTGDVFVSHRGYIAEYSPLGSLITDEIGSDELEEGYGLALSEYPATAGDLYLVDAGSHTIKVFDPANPGSPPLEEIDGAATPGGGFSYLRESEVMVDNTPGSPSYGHVFVVDETGHGQADSPPAVIDEFNAAGDYRGQMTGFSDAEPSGLAIDSITHNVFVTSGGTEGSAVFEYGPTASARGLTIVKEGSGDGNVDSGPSGIACGPECAAEFNQAQTVTLFANPDAHSVFSGWTVTGAEPCPGIGSCTVLMSNQVEVRANFTEPTQETLTLTKAGEGLVTSSPEGITCPSECTAQFSQGRLVTLTAQAAAHQKVLGWTGCTVQPNPGECKATMSAAQAVEVKFAVIPQLSLSVSKRGPGQGTVTSFPGGITCPGVCSSKFDEGSTVYLMAAPSPGSGFAGFGGGGCSGREAICAVDMTAAQSVTAEFTGTAQGQNALAASAASISIRSVRVQDGSALITLRVPEDGVLLAAGHGLRPESWNLSAGTDRVRLSLNRRFRRALRGHRRLQVEARLGFEPASSARGSTTAVMLRFRDRSKSATHPSR